ncbi:MAG TPA: alpha-glucan family phosphorylase [Actinomycetales bacterium]|nr:alpha-glucan family phosphorylase [Actinomycetales bacterium]
MRATSKFTVHLALPKPLKELGDLARNLRWSWHEPTRAFFESIDPEGWQEVHRDPMAQLANLAPAKRAELAQDSDFLARLRDRSSDLRTYLDEPRWYQQLQNADTELPAAIAYFSPEYGITATLPQYSGGLGILAGDHLKSASDLGVPLIGVGLLYGSGYFQQALTRDGWQTETYPNYDPELLPLTLLRETDGSPSEIKIDLPGGRVLHAQIWRADVGRVPLLLLDSNVSANDEDLRHVTDRLYGGGGEKRLQQEMLLGIGGVRALRLYERLTGGPRAEVYHTNEGHAGLLGIERIGELIADGLSFAEALEAVRAATVFTTHTPVPAGIDRFELELIRRHFADPGAVPAVAADDVLALGVEDYSGGDPTVFNMAVMGLRLAQRANGVSQLHGSVSREMFSGLWPGFDAAEVPITSITNGVHASTWVAEPMRALAQEKLREDALAGARGWEDPELITDEQLWQVLGDMRGQLVADVRRRLRKSWQQRGASPAELGWIDDVLDPNVLTIGFARRVPTYKRLTLMLREPQRLKDALLHPERPVQLIVAGKSHPEDEQGKRLIQELVRFADENDVRHRIVFLPDYDIAMAQELYPGCDVWLNNPLRPFEACGTSGMKAALNGGLNLSILDGWWNEWAQDGKNGWVIPSADGVNDPERRDDLEAAALYDLVENHVTPAFYETDAAGLPRQWLQMVRYTLDSLSQKVQATRMVAEYVERLYVPATASGRMLAAHGFAGARGLAAWKQFVRSGWGAVSVDHLEVDTQRKIETEQSVEVAAHVNLGELTPEDVRVQVGYGRVESGGRLIEPRMADLQHAETYEGGRHRYVGAVELEVAGTFGVSARIVPHHEGLARVSELGLVANS